MERSVKDLRKEGLLVEAYELATQNYMERPGVWTQRDVAWVLYEYIKKSVEQCDAKLFFAKLEELSNLGMHKDETMFADSIIWCYSKWIRANYNSQNVQHDAIIGINKLLDLARHIPINRPSDGYSALISAIHKALKGNSGYIDIMNRLGFDYFQKNDFEPFTTDKGKKIISQVEQIYNQYSKSLLSKIEIEKNYSGAVNGDTIKSVDDFLERLTDIIRLHPEYTYPLYYKAKLLLSLGRNDAVTSLLTPFVRKKSRDFWVWQILGDAVVEDKTLALSCYCKGLLCKNQEDMLVGLREAIARLMIESGDYAEAKLEVQKCIETRLSKWGKISSSLDSITKQEWFATTTPSKNNNSYYQSHADEAEMIVWGDDVRSILIDYVNKDKHIANFITKDDKVGYFMYDKLHKLKPNIGEVYNVVIDKLVAGKPSRISFFKRCSNNTESVFYKMIEGDIRRKEGAPFAFVNNTYIPPEIVSKYNLKDADNVKALAVRFYDKKKSCFSWRVTSIPLGQ